MKKQRPFDREKAKKELENIILEKIKELYLRENHKVKEKNDMSKKSDADISHIDDILKKLAEIQPVLVNASKLADQCQKIKAVQKKEFNQMLIELHNTFSEFVEKKKNFPIKPNDWVKKAIKETYNLAHDLEKCIPQINSEGCCGGGKYKKSFESKSKRLSELQCFWFGLVNSDAREGFQEVHIIPNFNENEFRKELRNYFEDHFPHEQEPQIIKQEIIKRVETDAKPDFIRLAHELLFGFGRPQDVIGALKIYHQEADRPAHRPDDINVYACNSLGKIYLEGKYVPRDFKKALSYFEKSLTRDENDKDAEALYQLGLMEEKGLLTEGGKTEEENVEMDKQNVEMAKQYFMAAAEKGHKDAITDLGFIAHEEKDYKLAFEYYKMAKKMKHPRALNNLGKLYMENLLPEKIKGENYRKAIKYFEVAAEFGNNKALYNLGVCFEKGIGVEQNLEKANSLFKDSARKGDIEGKLFYSSHILRNALGTNKDDDYLEAATMLNEVVAEDNKKESAYYYLGYLYEYGFGVGKDYKVALNFYYKASKLNFAPAYNKLGNFFYSGYGVERVDLKKAIDFYEIAVKMDDPDALINMGVLYETGNEIFEKDIGKAVMYFKKASKELGDPRGFVNIGHIFAEGKYGEKNLKKAIKNYEKAANLGDKLAIELLAAKGKTHMQATFNKEKDLLKKSQIGKFCNDNLINSGREQVIQNSMSAVKKGKDREKSSFINGIVASGIPKEFVQKSQFNPQEYDFYRKDEQIDHHSDRHEFDYNSDRKEQNTSFENQKLLENNSHRLKKNKIPQIN